MLSKKAHTMRVFSPYAFGGYYLSFAGGDASQFRHEYNHIRPSSSFGTLEDEVVAIDKINDESYPSRLREKPAFVFNAFKNGPLNKPFFDRLLKTQKQIQALLKRSDFLEKVLEKISGVKPIITCKKNYRADQKIRADFSDHEWTRILRSAANRFEDQEEKLAFFESYCQPTEKCQAPPKMVGASKAMLTGIKKALTNLAISDNFFETIAKDSSLESIVSRYLYFKTTGEVKANN